MGFLYRRSIKIAPGFRVNLGKKGFSSFSVGGKGARVNFGGKRRAKATLGGGLIRGLSYQVPLSGSAAPKEVSSGKRIYLVEADEQPARRGFVMRWLHRIVYAVAIAIILFLVLSAALILLAPA